MQNFQQHLLRTIWKPKKDQIRMIIKGKILSHVHLDDIGKHVECGKEISLNEYEVNRSKDLQNAIKRNWIEVVFDRNLVKKPQIQEKSQEVDLELAKKLALTMVEEMIKNSSIVREVAKEIAKEMVSEIQGNLKIEQVVVQQNNTNTVTKESNDVFIDFSDEEVGLKSNTKDIGTVEVQKDDLTSSLEKMKRFKQLKQGS